MDSEADNLRPEGGNPAPRKRKRLTPQQRKIARLRVKHPDETQSEIAARVPTSREVVAETIAKPHVQDRIRELMDANPKLTDEALTKKLASKIEAKETKFFQHEGRVMETRDVVDHGTQLKALEMAFELKGAMEKRIRVTQDPQPPMSLEATVAICLRIGIACPTPSPIPLPPK